MQGRRKFLKQIFFTTTTGIISASLLQACSGNQPANEPNNTNPTGPQSANPDAQTNHQVIDSSQLTQEDFDKRKNLGYVDKTPIEENHCSNCALYLKPNGNGKPGGCQLFRGPVSPDGYCPYWAPLQEL